MSVHNFFLWCMNKKSSSKWREDDDDDKNLYSHFNAFLYAYGE